MITNGIYFDTSALIKLYHDENGTDKVSGLIDRENPEIVISELTKIEIISAFAKKVRTKEIDPGIFNAAVMEFEGDLKEFVLIEIDNNVKKKSIELLKSISVRKGLRTLDAIQLASGFIAFERKIAKLFVTSDRILSNIAKELKLNSQII